MMATGATAVALALEALGVTTVFTVPSAHNLSILREIEQRGLITVVGCRHEQGAVHSADGYARTSGALGVAIVSGGPGTANTMGGMYEAHFASSPVLLITSQIDTAFQGRGRAYVHEADNQRAMLQTVTTETVSILGVDEIADAVIRLARRAVTGRPRPVALEIPIDLQDAAVAVDADLICERAHQELPSTIVNHTQIAAAAKVLTAALRPVIWAGGGVIRSGGAKALLELARRLQIPVVTSREGRGAISENDPLCLGAFAAAVPMREFISGCDVMLAVGTRFQMYATGEWTLPIPANLIHIDIDPSVIGRSYQPSVRVIADAGKALQALDTAMEAPTPAQLIQRATHLRAGLEAMSAAKLGFRAEVGADHLQICQTIADNSAAETVLVCDATVPAYAWGDRLLPIERPRTSIRCAAAGIGPGLPLAIGAAFASGQHSVLLQGDGGFMLSVGELATAVQHQLPVIICLFDDKGYGMLKNIQRHTGQEKPILSDLSTPNFFLLAKAFGVSAHAVSDPAGFNTAFTTSLATRGPTLIHIDMSKLIPIKR